MATKTKSQDRTKPIIDADSSVEDLARIAFANILDFTQFGDGGQIQKIDFVKAREVGATVSVVTRKVGRGKNARQVQRTSIKMPNKFRALMLLGKCLGLFGAGRR
jgi:hypothetical protein